MPYFVYVFFFSILSLSAFSQQDSPDSMVMATVDGEPICVREFNLVSQKYKALVIQEFRKKYKLNYDAGFWCNESVGESPAENLKRRTLKTLISIKVQQLQAKKMGIISDLSYHRFLNTLAQENQRRLIAKSNNRVIFGPVQYSEEVYYDYVFSNVVIQLKSKLNVNDKQYSDYINQQIAKAIIVQF